MKKLLLLTTALACAIVSGGPTTLPFPGAGPYGPPPQCTGGTVSVVLGKNRYVFTATGTLTCSGGRPVRMCLIAGGASGGATTGTGSGGGGAGGLRFFASLTLPGGPNTITVGPGGAPATVNGLGNPGGDSIALGQTSTGGGPGAFSSNGGNGGSGGGGSPAAGNTGGTGIAGQGFAGAAGNNSFGTAAGGGGGGAGAAGTAASGSTPGNGGNGAACPIDTTTYAGGGAGLRTQSPGTGGSGGGGTLCNPPTANTGSGAGGGDLGFCGTLPAGAAGKVIIEEL